jgi:hypothetical protein
MVSEAAGVKPLYPIYIPSKGRADRPYTIKLLNRDHVPYYVVVQPQDAEAYSAIVPPERMLVLPRDNEYDGLLMARNWIWDHAQRTGAKWFWQLDDNIRGMYVVDVNRRRTTPIGWTMRAMEEFCDRYENVAQAGPTYAQFIHDISNPRSRSFKHFLLFNSRIYSFTLTRTDIPFRYELRYNDDTDISLRILKAGWCTVLFRNYSCSKIRTMMLKGGNTDKLYRQTEDFDGRLEMAKALYRRHPDVTQILWKWGRWQHHVDYRRFAGNKLKLRPEYAADGCKENEEMSSGSI